MQKFRTSRASKGTAGVILASLLFFFGAGQMDKVFGQGSGPVTVLYPTVAPAGACGYTQIRIVRSTGNIYGCVAGSWSLIQTTGSSTDWNLITNKPSAFSPSAHATSHAAAGTDPLTLSASQVGLGNVNNTSDAAKPVSTATQTALNGKVDTTTTVNGHALSANVTVTKGDVGLGNVDNTSDAAKPVSTAQQTALNGKVDTTRTINGFPLSANITLTKGDVGLGNVDNTSDASKPVSTATSTALGLKVDKTTTVNGHALSGNVSVTTTDLGLQNVNNTSDANKPISTATQSALDSLGLLAFRGKGDYNTMTACSTATCPTNSLWLLTNAVSSGLCTSGQSTNTAYAICVKDASAIWQPILAVTGGGGTGGGGTTTVYGGWTGGGATVVVSDADCANANDSATLNTRISSLANNGTLDFQNTTNPCDVGSTSALNVPSLTNVRITHSPTIHPSGGDIRGVASQIYVNEYSTILRLDTCTNCLVDKLYVNINLAYAQGIFCHFCTNSSIQNTKVYDTASNGCENSAGGCSPQMTHGAMIRMDGGTNNFTVSNTVTNATASQAGNATQTGGLGHGVRCVWMGVGGEYEVNPTGKDNVISNCGHTGLVSESQNAIITGNSVTGLTVQGTCYKFIARGASADSVWDNNSCDTTTGHGGFQEDSSSVKPTHTYIRNNSFKNVSSNACCFGALYLSGADTGGNMNIVFTGNTIDNGWRVGNVNNTHGLLVQNNVRTNIRTGSGGDGNQLDLEDQNTDITVVNSGTVSVGGTGNARITVDGVTVVAWLPKPFQHLPGAPSRETLVYASLAAFILFDRYKRVKM